MIYIVKDIIDERATKSGKKMTKAILTDGKQDYPVNFWDKDVMVGDKVDGEMKEYDSKWKNYKFSLKAIQRTPESKKGISDDVRQSNIAFESFFASACNLLQGKDIGQAVALTYQMHTYLMEGKWILLANSDQIKKIVSAYGLKTAREKAYEKYGIPYLHMLTSDQAEELIREI